MADKVSTSYTVSMVAEFSDGDTRTITQDKPVENTASLVSAINAFSAYVKTNNILVGDKAGGAFMGVKEAKIRTTTSTKFDLS
ncbi:MAG: hypothetical protein IKT98_04410 [Selenomonadaceae bacterium]|nr:hypothetical protein [Selenomonadaceae bacterium]